MSREVARRVRADVTRLVAEGLDWVSYATRLSEALARVIPFQRNCWHTVDPGTVLFTGSLNHNVACSGFWLAEHEYILDDVNKWWFLARSGRLAGATSLATHGDLSRSARHRSHKAYGIGDELRGAFVSDGVYWGAVGLLRDSGESWFTEAEVQLLAAVSRPIADGFRRALLRRLAADAPAADTGPGVVVFGGDGSAESISPAAEYWIDQMVEVPAPSVPADSKVVQAVAARARALRHGQDPLALGARSRVRTRSGAWLLLYGTRLSGASGDRTAVIIQSAAPAEVTPLIALAYCLTERESQVTRLCMQGHSTKQIAQTLHVSPYTVQDHLKSIFAKTGVRSRGELVGQLFLEHWVPRWEEQPDVPPGWTALGSSFG